MFLGGGGVLWLLWLVSGVGGSGSRPFNKVEVILEIKATPHCFIALLPLTLLLHPRHNL